MNRFAEKEEENFQKARKPAAKAGATKVVLLRRKELGNNCRFIANEFEGMNIVMPDEVPADATHIIRWGTTSNLPNRPAGMAKRTIFNEAAAIHSTTDKMNFRIKLDKVGLAPRTWRTLAELQKAEDVSDDGVIVRPAQHERSEGLYLCRTLDELNKAIGKIKGEYYISEFIPKDREVRVFVVQGKAIMAFEKKPKNRKDVSWGCVEEGALEYIRWSEWPVNAVTTAIKAFNLSDLDFGAVDVIIKGNKSYALEINTAPEVWPYYGQCFALAFKYMIANGKERIKTTKWNDWHDLIHPCMG